MMPSVLYTTQYTQATLAATAVILWKYMQAFSVVIFSGEMGAGKTTLIRALCAYIGVKESVTSPTFALVNTYTFMQQGQTYQLFHMDWFRMPDIDALYDMDIMYYMQRSHSYCFIEWGDKFMELFTSPFLRLHIEEEDKERRLCLMAY